VVKLSQLQLHLKEVLGNLETSYDTFLLYLGMNIRTILSRM